MTRLSRMTVLGATAIAVLALGACRRKPAAPPPTTTSIPASVNQDSINRVRDALAAEEARRRAEQQRADSIRNAEALTSATQRELTTALQNIIYFGYNDDALMAEARALLDTKLPILLANPAVRMRIAGHTDERGSAEYNLALGQRRAASVKRYLVDRGVGDERIEVVSFGEEQPAAEGAVESAWSQNRRAEFEITSPAAPLARPRS